MSSNQPALMTEEDARRVGAWWIEWLDGQNKWSHEDVAQICAASADLARERVSGAQTTCDESI